MRRIFLLLAIVSATILSSCEGPQGVPGQNGTNVEAEVFELLNVDFNYDSQIGYNIYQSLNPQIYDSDVIMIYRLSGTIDTQTPIWQSIPRTLYLNQGELDYDFDFSKEDFTIYAGGNFDIAMTPNYLNNQTFRIVIIPGYFSNKGTAAVDLNDYNAVIKAYHIDDSKIKTLN